MFINVGEAKAPSKHETHDTVVQNQSAVTPSAKVLPNFIGLDKQSIAALISTLPIKARHYGVGLVSRQGVPAGTFLSDTSIEVDLYYEPPNVE